jgi:hypothetical protein
MAAVLLLSFRMKLTPLESATGQSLLLTVQLRSGVSGEMHRLGNMFAQHQ